MFRPISPLDGRPCNNTSDQMKTYYHCILEDTTQPWCSTRVFHNLSHMSFMGMWGYCSPECTGEVQQSSRKKYNLADNFYSGFWEETLFDMDGWGAGHCHTYNPPRKSSSGMAGQLYFHLGSSQNTFTNDLLVGYNIYLHEAGQFWPGIETERIGQSELLLLETNRQWEGSFTVTHQLHLHRDSSPCEEDPKYSYTTCILNYIAQSAGCHLDWFRQDFSYLFIYQSNHN